MDGTEPLASGFERPLLMPAPQLQGQNELSTASRDDQPGGLADVPPGLGSPGDSPPRT